MRRFLGTVLPFAAFLGVVALAACSNGGTSTPGVPTTSFTPLPVLVAGSQFTYAGTFSENITYASPSPQQPNSTGTYSTTDAEKILTAGSGAPGPIDVHRTIRYRVKHAPVSGLQPQQRTIDSYQSSTVASGSQTINFYAGTTVANGIDRSANRKSGNGPYTYHGTNTVQYASPYEILVFPLAPGSTQEPLARSVMEQFQSLNAGGTIFAQRNTTTDFKNTGSYTESGTIAPGVTTYVKADADGTGHLNNSGSAPLEEKIGLPAPGPSSTYQIPVTRTSGGVKHTYLAADWYPGNAAPPSPLATTVQTVIGSSKLPGACHVKVQAPNVQEVDSASTSLDVVHAVYTVGKTQDFLSNGTTVCRIASATTTGYNVITGLLLSTTVDSFAESLVTKSIP